MIIKKPHEIYPNIVLDILIFLSAYCPLFAILFIKSITHNKGQIALIHTELKLYTSYVATILVTSSLISCLIVASQIRNLTKNNEGDTKITINKAERIRGDMLNYTMPILISLLGFDYTTWQSTTSLLLFLLLMFWLCRIERTSLLNPFFLLINIRLYSITYKEIGRAREKNGLAICFGAVSPSEETLHIKESSGINIIYQAGEEK